MASSASIEKIKAIQNGLGLQNISGQWNEVVEIEFSSLLQNLISWKKKFGENISIPNWILNTSEGRYPELKFRGNLNQALELVENKEKYYKEFLRLKEPSAEQRDNFVYTLFLLYIQKILNQKTTGVLSDELHKKYPNSTTSTGLKDIIKDLSSNDQFKKLDLIKNKLGVTGNLWDYETLFNLNKKINEVCQQEGFVKNIYGVNFCDTTIDVIDGLVQFKDDNEQTVGKEAVSFHSGNKFFNKTTAYRNKGVGESMSMSNNKNVRNAGVRAAQLAEIAIISKVAARKERAKVNLIKMANNDYEQEINEIKNNISKSYSTFLSPFDPNKKQAGETHIMIDAVTRKISDIIFYYGKFYALRDDLSFIKDKLTGIARMAEEDYSEREKEIGGDEKELADLFKSITSNANLSLSYVLKEGKVISNYNVVSKRDTGGAQAQLASPIQTPTIPTAVTQTTAGRTSQKRAIDTSKVRDLLNNLHYNPGNGPKNEWDGDLNKAFVDAYMEYCKAKGISCTKEDKWANVARGLDFAPDISGAEDMLEALLEIKSIPATGSASTANPANTKTNPDSDKVIVQKSAVVTALSSLFEKISNGQIRVDQAGLDWTRDTKNFKGIIRGLGGDKKAAIYCVEYCNFDTADNNQIIKEINNNNISNKSNYLNKIFTLFDKIKREATKGFGRDRRGLTENSLARSVERYMVENRVSTVENKVSTSSISKAIEMRKLAARKRLGL